MGLAFFVATEHLQGDIDHTNEVICLEGEWGNSSGGIVSIYCRNNWIFIIISIFLFFLLIII